MTVRDRLDELAAKYRLGPDAPAKLELILGLVAVERSSITSVRDPSLAVEVHVADSLTGLEIDELPRARRIADLGSGGGFPGLVLAVALPDATLTLVESAGRKCAFLERAADAAGLSNVHVVHARAEEWAGTAEPSDLATARALAPLPVLLEYAAPLLELDGSLVAWKGRRDPVEEADASAAARILGMSVPQARSVEPPHGVVKRTLYLSSKLSATPSGYPRRSGMASKRPLRASG
jgi:16S rRNA (guanine527-N7)-methyltransferase